MYRKRSQMVSTLKLLNCLVALCAPPAARHAAERRQEHAQGHGRRTLSLAPALWTSCHRTHSVMAPGVAYW